MDSTDAFIAAHNAEGVVLEEEDKEDMYPLDKDELNQVRYQPRTTYEAIVYRVEAKKKKSEDTYKLMDYEQKKRAL